MSNLYKFSYCRKLGLDEFGVEFSCCSDDPFATGNLARLSNSANRDCSLLVNLDHTQKDCQKEHPRGYLNLRLILENWLQMEHPGVPDASR